MIFYNSFWEIFLEILGNLCSSRMKKCKQITNVKHTMKINLLLCVYINLARKKKPERCMDKERPGER